MVDCLRGYGIKKTELDAEAFQGTIELVHEQLQRVHALEYPLIF